jgi:hypothetical protein
VDIQSHVSMLMHSWNLQTSNVALPQWIKSGDNPRHLEEKVPAPTRQVLLTEAITGPGDRIRNASAPSTKPAHPRSRSGSAGPIMDFRRTGPLPRQPLQSPSYCLGHITDLCPTLTADAVTRPASPPRYKTRTCAGDPGTRLAQSPT